MTTTLSMTGAQRLLAALRSIDADADVKLSGLTRLAIAVDINRLMPDVAAFELAVQKLQRAMLPGEAARESNMAVLGEIEALFAATQDFDLRSFAVADLSLDDNLKIKADQIASLAPVLTDFEARAQAA